MTTVEPSARSVAEALNRSARRVFQAGRQAEWCSAVLDAAMEFCERAALFTLQGSHLRLELASFSTDGEISVALADAPALAEVISSREPVAAAWSVRELSVAIMDRFGGPRVGARAYLFPIASGGRAMAVLLADGGGATAPDTNGLELVCGIAGAAWELSKRRNESSASASNGLVMLAPSTMTTKPVEEDEHHRRARRFASVRVAELSLYQAAQVREGRLGNNLYDLFREAIERARATFRAEFMEKSPSMVDYLHDELVRTLAQGERGRLGESYPGAMVRS